VPAKSSSYRSRIRSRVSCVASTAPWPRRAWSEWPWVITALATGRTGSMWKPPRRQQSPAGVGASRSSGRIASRYVISTAMEVRVDPLFQSSGDLLADRRYGVAVELAARGDRPGAIDVLMQAIELAPGFAFAWFALADLREVSGDRSGAVEAFRRAHAADPVDRHGAGLRLARLNARVPDAMPAGYVRALFDQYAPRFDSSLEALSYRGPALLLDAIRRWRTQRGQRLRFGTVLDLGC